MKKIKFALKSFILIVCFLTIFSITAFADSSEQQRIYGADRYKTALSIAEQVNSNQVNCVVLAPGNSYANALPASVLAYKNNAPLLLVNYTANGTFEAFDYIKAHLPLAGKVYLVGDKNYIGNDFITKLNSMGYYNIITISGVDMYKTDYLIAKELNVVNNTPFVISSGVNFPDALSISSVASSKGWPILLTDGNTLNNDIKSLISEKLPSTIYITGGPTAIDVSVENQIKSIAPNAAIKRLGGSDRYETATLISNNFFPSSSNIYIASGADYPDTLAGSVLAAKNNSPIVLIDPNAKLSVPDYVVKYLVDFRKSHASKNLIALGGTKVVPDYILTMTNDLVGNMRLTSLGQPVEFDYNFIEDPQCVYADWYIQGNGNLTEKEEIARTIAVRFLVESRSISYSMLQSVDKYAFGSEYGIGNTVIGIKNRAVKMSKKIADPNYYQRVKKITLTSYGKNISDSQNPLSYFSITAEMEGHNEKDVTFTLYDTIMLTDINGYWQVRLEDNPYMLGA